MKAIIGLELVSGSSEHELQTFDWYSRVKILLRAQQSSDHNSSQIICYTAVLKLSLTR